MIEEVNYNYDNSSVQEVEPQSNTAQNEYEQETIEEYLNNENTILIVVDVHSAYCRLFGTNCFIEKPIRTINADNKGNKPYYCKRTVRKYKNRFRNTFGLSDEQIKRVDILIYSILREYDDSLWTDKRVESHRAESYVQIMTNDYERIYDETDQEYLVRSKRIRKLALAKVNIDIEYKLDDMWKFNKLKISDKFRLKKYASEFEIQD
ncbi:MAG: hypothetical protein Q4E75_06985, partial [bacterium]|nr:hypothetical protein [bacterium]